MAASDDLQFFCQSLIFLAFAYVAMRQTVPQFLKCVSEKELRQQRAWCAPAPPARMPLPRARDRRRPPLAGT